jgi:hypothetical protein
MKHYYIVLKSKFNELKTLYGKVYKKDGNKYPEAEDLESGILDYYVEMSEDEKIDFQTKFDELKKARDEWKQNYYHPEDGDSNKKYWNKNVFERPETLNFWFDFLDTEGELTHFSVKSIGSRPKAVNDTNIKAIYFKTTPDVLFIKD